MLIKPTYGQITLFSNNEKYNEVERKRNIGLVTANSNPIPDLTVEENIKFFGSFYFKNKKRLIFEMNKILNMLDLEEYRKKRIELLSSGNKQKVAFAKAIISSPKLLILDEPMNGLDIATKNNIKELIKELNVSGTTIIYTSHNMEEIEELVSRICILNKGKLVFNGTFNEINNNRDYLEKLLIEGSL